MSVSAILSNDLFVQFQQQQQQQPTSVQNNQQQFQQEFAQLGQDLQAGNLSAAQSDFATLEQLTPQSQSATSTSTTATNNPIAQAFSQLGQDLASGNTAAAQQDFTNLQQDLQNAQHTSFHHHHHGGGGDGNSEASQISQLFQQLGQDLQSGNLSQAQSAYNSIVQNFQQELTGGTSTGATSTSTATNTPVSLNA